MSNSASPLSRRGVGEIAAGELVLRLGAALMLLILSGTFSGLTLGLLGLDITGLDVRRRKTLSLSLFSQLTIIDNCRS